MIWWCIVVFAVAGLIITFSICAINGQLDQQDEDRYGVEKARRS